MKKAYITAEITVLHMGADDIMTVSGLTSVNALETPIFDNLEINELPIF